MVNQTNPNCTTIKFIIILIRSPTGKLIFSFSIYIYNLFFSIYGFNLCFHEYEKNNRIQTEVDIIPERSYFSLIFTFELQYR